MLKAGTTLFIILAIVIVTVTSPIVGQPPVSSGPNDPPANLQEKAEDEKAKKNRPDLKKVFEEETKKFNEKSAEFDPVKLEIEKGKQQAKRGWSKKDTALIVAFGIAVLVYLVVQYGKTSTVKTVSKPAHRTAISAPTKVAIANATKRTTRPAASGYPEKAVEPTLSFRRDSIF